MSTDRVVNKGDLAAALFRQGYNCAQAVVLTFADELASEIHVDEKTLAKLASSFGGGMGRLREVCGAVSGMFMVCGMISGYDSPTRTAEEKEEKAAHYQRIQEMAAEFEKIHGSIICRDILKKPAGADNFVPADRTEEYYASRPCEKCVRNAAEILEKFLNT